MSTIAVHVPYGDVVARCHCDTVVLVAHPRIAQSQIVASRDVEAIAVVGRRKAFGTAVGRITSGVVQRDIVQAETIRVGDVEAVYRPVLDVEVFDHRGTVRFADSYEVIGLGDTAIGTKAIPPGLTVAVNYGVWFGRDGNIRSSNLDEVDVAIEILEGCFSGEGDRRASLQLGQIECLIAWHHNIRKRDRSTRCYRGGYVGELRHCTGAIAGCGCKICDCSQSSGSQDYLKMSFSCSSILVGGCTLGSHF